MKQKNTTISNIYKTQKSKKNKSSSIFQLSNNNSIKDKSLIMKKYTSLKKEQSLSQTYHFPQFQIYKIDNSNKIFQRQKNCKKQKKRVKTKDEININKMSQTMPIKSSFQTIQKMQEQFKQALQKLFKTLDIFGTGKIKKGIIKKKLDEKSIFNYFKQNLNEVKSTLQIKQFIKLCMPKLYQLNLNQIKQVLFQAQKLNQINKSLHINQTQHAQNISRIQYRIPHQKTPLKQNKNKQINNLIIYQTKDKNTQKSNEQTPLQINKIINNIKTDKENKYFLPHKKQIPLDLLNKYKQIQNIQNNSTVKKQQYSSCKKIAAIINTVQQRLKDLKYYKTSQFLFKNDQPRMIQLKRKGKIIQTDRSMLEQQNKKLDQLSSKVQQYIQLNSSKINRKLQQ